MGEKNHIEAEEYAKKSDAECMIRVFADGKMQIKEFKTNEITQTTVDEFLDYYGDDYEEECSCDHEHHHHDGCDCGKCH